MYVWILPAMDIRPSVIDGMSSLMMLFFMDTNRNVENRLTKNVKTINCLLINVSLLEYQVNCCS